MKTMTRKTILVWACLIASPVAWAQLKVNYGEMKSKYPNDEVLLLNQIEKIDIGISGDKLSIEVEHQEDNMFLNERASYYAEKKIHYSDFFEEIYDIEAFSYIPEGSKFQKRKVSSIKTEKPSSAGIFYDDTYVKSFTYEGAKIGAMGSVHYKRKIKDPHVIGGFMFGHYMPVQHAEFSVTFPESVKLKYKTYGDVSGIEFQQTTSKGKTTYTWRANDLKAHPYESRSQNIRYSAPQVFLFVENYSIGNKTTEVLADEQKLFNFYVGLVKDVNKKPDAALKAFADSLTRGKTELEKIKTVYYWVQDHVKYIAFEDGLGGLIPRPAKTVYEKRYGDCKDMASIITTLLTLSGVEAHLVWIGTRDIPFKYSENPSLSADNHMIAAVKQNGNWVFLDATADKIDYGLPTPHIQGKQAMVMLSENTFSVVDVPVVDKTSNWRKDTIDIQLQGTSLSGKGHSLYEGLWKMEQTYQLAAYSEKEREEYYKSMFSRGNNKCKLGTVTTTELKARETPLSFTYTFSVPDFARQIGNEIFLNPHLSKPWESSRIEESRKTAIEYEFKTSDQHTTVLHIPDGYMLDYVPKDKAFTTDEFGFSIRYVVKGSTLIITNELYMNTLLVKKEKFSTWNQMVSILSDAYRESISLKKK